MQRTIHKRKYIKYRDVSVNILGRSSAASREELLTISAIVQGDDVCEVHIGKLEGGNRLLVQVHGVCSRVLAGRPLGQC